MQSYYCFEIETHALLIKRNSPVNGLYTESSQLYMATYLGLHLDREGTGKGTKRDKIVINES